MKTIEQTWSDRLAASNGIDIRPVPEGRRGMTAGRLMLYPSARMVNEAIRAIPPGQTITPKELRAVLSDQHGADYTCPVTTSRMLVIVAEAAHESRVSGSPLGAVTPIWRVLDGTGSFPKRLSFDLDDYLDVRADEQTGE